MESLASGPKNCLTRPIAHLALIGIVAILYGALAMNLALG